MKNSKKPYSLIEELRKTASAIQIVDASLAKEMRKTASELEKCAKDEQLRVLADANQIADEWVTEMRLAHVLDKLGLLDSASMSDTRNVVNAMREDVTREAEGEIVMSPEALRAIGKKAAILFKGRVVAAG